jgi:hypothetical protein
MVLIGLLLIYSSCENEKRINLEVKGLITDNVSGVPIGGVSVNGTQNDIHGDPVIVATTTSNSKGEYSLLFTEEIHCKDAFIGINATIEGYQQDSFFTSISCSSRLGILDLKLDPVL